jgi:hypothetical protein
MDDLAGSLQFLLDVLVLCVRVHQLFILLAFVLLEFLGDLPLLLQLLLVFSLCRQLLSLKLLELLPAGHQLVLHFAQHGLKLILLLLLGLEALLLLDQLLLYLFLVLLEPELGLLNFLLLRLQLSLTFQLLLLLSLNFLIGQNFHLFALSLQLGQ